MKHSSTVTTVLNQNFLHSYPTAYLLGILFLGLLAASDPGLSQALSKENRYCCLYYILLPLEMQETVINQGK
jgi:hypothetical protein